MFYNSVAEEVKMDVNPIIDTIHTYIAPLIRYFETSVVGFNKAAVLVRQPLLQFDYKPGDVTRLIKLTKEATSAVERFAMTPKKDQQPPSPEEVEKTYQSYQTFHSLRVEAEMELRNHIIKVVSITSEKVQTDHVFSNELGSEIEKMRREKQKGKKKR